jgi:type II secretory pathway component GspD/PulD (secretin)
MKPWQRLFVVSGCVVCAVVISAQADIAVETSGIDYLPPLSSDLIKNERTVKRTAQLEQIRKIVEADQGKKAKKKKGAKAPVKGKAEKKQTGMNQAAAQQAAIEQEIFNLLNQEYQDEILQKSMVSLQIKKMPIKEVIKLLAKSTGVSFIVDADVHGSVDELSAQNLPLAVLLRSLLASSTPRLALVKDAGVWRIMPYLAAREHVKGLVAEARDKDVVTGVFALEHVKWTPALKQRIEKLWQGIVQASPEKQFFYMVQDDTNNKIIFKARRAYAEEFEKHLREFDVHVPEVRINIRVVSADKNFEESLGFNWSGVYNRTSSLKRMDFAGLGPVDSRDGRGADETTPFNKIVGWALNFVPSSVTSAIKVPFVFGNKDMNTKRLTLELNAAESRNEIRTILKPSLLVHSEESAEILVGSELPMQVKLDEAIEGKLTNVTTVRYKDIGTKVKVTPVVSPNQQDIFMDIFVENSQIAYLSGGQKIGTGSQNDGFNYTIDTSRSQNRVLLRSGETTMIGGLITNQQVNEKNGVPLLQDIPLLKLLFSWSRKKIVDKQLLIFITPELQTV